MEKLKLKTTVLVYKPFNKNTTVRFNSELISFEDNNGRIYSFLTLLNDYKTESEIKKQFVNKYDDIDESDIDEYLVTLRELNLIETQFTTRDILDEYDSYRWSRNFEFFNTLISYGENKYKVQQKLALSKVCLLGCGGIGSHILFELAAVGIKDLVIVDFDKIELSNLNRQILYKEEDVGFKKVITAKKRILEFSPTMNVNAIDLRISSAKDITDIISDRDLVICVADKPRNYMVKWLNQACCDLGIPFINGGLDTRRAVFYSVIPGESGCTECWRSSLPADELQAHIVAEDYNENIDYQAPAPAMSALVSVTTGVMLCEAIKMITGLQPPTLTNRLKSFCFDDLSIETTEKWQRNDNCSCCGNLKNS